MKFCVLGSGSKGNCTLIQSGKTTILIDAGFSGVEIKRRLQSVHYNPDIISAILVTHEHNDHISGVGIVSRQASVPIFANPATHRASSGKVGKPFATRDFGTGETFLIGDLQVHPFSISHDSADPVGFVISDGRQSIGYCTDTGKITTLIEHQLKQCQALILESNHDPQMLRNGPYPLRLQQRVRSSRGHLANEDAAGLLQKLAGGVLRQVVLAHLSETNNLPELAFKATTTFLGTDCSGICINLAAQDTPSPLIDTEE